MSRIVVIAVLLLAGCVQYALVPPERTILRGKLEVEPGMAWNAHEEGPLTYWTLDGPGLQILAFHVALDDGDSLYRFPSVSGEIKRPVYRKGMTEIEILDLYVQSLGLIMGVAPKVDQVDRARFAGRDGFRFNYTVTGKDSVRRQGVVTATTVDGRLYLVDYRGTALYHFKRSLPEAERILASAKIR